MLLNMPAQGLDRLDAKTTAYIAAVLFHSKQTEALHTSRGLLGVLGL